MSVFTSNTTKVIKVSPTSAKVILASTQGPQGEQGIQGVPGPTQVDDTVLGSTTKTIDSILVVDFASVKWWVLIEDLFSGAKRWQEIGAMHDSVGAKHTIYGVLGDSMPYTLDVTLTAGVLALSLTNTGANTLTTHVVRVLLFV